MYVHVKRGLDVAIALVALVVLSPVMLMIAAAVRATSPGPVFFRQKRVGIHRSHFMIYKFRTMRTDAPKDAPTHLLQPRHSGKILCPYPLCKPAGLRHGGHRYATHEPHGAEGPQYHCHCHLVNGK